MILLQNIEPSTYYYQPSWVMVIIVLSLMLLGYLYSAFNSRFSAFIKAVFISRFSVQASREERSLSHPVSLLLSVNFILIVSLFVLQLFSSGAFFHSGTDFSLPSFFLIALIIFCVYAVKTVFLKVTGFILDKQEILEEYNFTIFLVNQFLGLALLPAVIFAAYGPPEWASGVLLTGVILCAAAFFLRIGKGIAAILERRNAPLFYIILYLCTLEILPLLVGVKLFERLV